MTCKCGMSMTCMCQPIELTDNLAEIKLQSKYRTYTVVQMYRGFRQTESIREAYCHVVQVIQENIMAYQQARGEVVES